MYVKPIAVATLPLIVSGCGVWIKHQPEPASAPSARQTEAAETPLGKLVPWPEEASEASHAGAKPGDYFVYRFAGSFTDSLVVLTEQIVGLEEDLIVVDFTLEQGDVKETLRVRMDAKTRTVVRASRMSDKAEIPVSVAAYEALMQRTQFVADSNDEALASKDSTCLVGIDEVECQVTSYRVSVGSDAATLTISTSDQVPGRDIGGTLTNHDGELLYSARLVERGHEAPESKAVAAKQSAAAAD